MQIKFSTSWFSYVKVKTFIEKELNNENLERDIWEDHDETKVLEALNSAILPLPPENKT